MPNLDPFWTVTVFWIVAAVCVLIALAFVLPPLLRRKEATAKAARRDINIAVYRDQMKEMEADRTNGLLSEEQFQTAKLELEARLAEDALAQADGAMAAKGSRRLGFSMVAIFPAAAIGLYFWLGNPLNLSAIVEAQANPNVVQGEHDIMKMIQQVEEKTRSNPDDGAAWAMLGRTYGAVEHWAEAEQAYAKAYKLLPEVAAVLSGYAEAVAINSGRVLAGKPMELVRKALELDPNDMKALELAGINAFQERNFAQASYYFKHLYKQLPPDSPYAQDILAAQQEAKRQSEGGLTGMDNLADQGPEQAPAQAAGPTIQGKIDIAPALKAKVSEKDVIFLFARGSEGGPPAAAIRATAGKFPLEFELNDSMAMNPENRLSKFKEVILTARVAKSGDVKGAAGDLEGTLAKVKVGAKGVTLTIDTVRN